MSTDCYVKVDNRSWCRCMTPDGFLTKAMALKISTTCAHSNESSAVALVYLLQDFGMHARIVNGQCDWSPVDLDLDALGAEDTK